MDRYLPSQSEAAREQHHHRLVISMNGLDEVTAQLHSLLLRIQKDNDDSLGKGVNQLQPEPEPHSLAAVLKSAPDRIREAKSQQLDLISSINEALF